MREFRFAEVTRSMSERGYCFIHADFYQEVRDRYYRIDRIDTLITVKAMDVTKGTLKKGAGFLIEMISRHLNRSTNESISFSYREIKNIDSVEKSHMAAFTDTAFTDGLYRNYASFRDQTPDQTVTGRPYGLGLKEVRTTGADGKPTKVKLKDVYAVVISGNTYIATDYDYYQLRRQNGDFYFTGGIKVSPGNASMMAAGLMFGMLGTLLASDASATFEMKLDHLTGGFIQLREIPMTVQP